MNPFVNFKSVPPECQHTSFCSFFPLIRRLCMHPCPETNTAVALGNWNNLKKEAVRGQLNWWPNTQSSALRWIQKETIIKNQKLCRQTDEQKSSYFLSKPTSFITSPSIFTPLKKTKFSRALIKIPQPYLSNIYYDPYWCTRLAVLELFLFLYLSIFLQVHCIFIKSNIFIFLIWMKMAL